MLQVQSQTILGYFRPLNSQELSIFSICILYVLSVFVFDLTSFCVMHQPKVKDVIRRHLRPIAEPCLAATYLLEVSTNTSAKCHDYEFLCSVDTLQHGI